MKNILILLCVAMVLLTGCSQVPTDVESAQIAQDLPDDTVADVDVETDTEVLAPNDKVVDEVQNAPIEEIDINTETSSFTFEGFAPGKSHAGTFDELSATLQVLDGTIIGMQSQVQADSVNTGIGGLDDHLQNEDFFDVALYPTIDFTSSSITDDTATGMLNVHGVEKEVSFPVTRDETSISADFLLDTTPFGMKHAGVDKEVKITFEFSTE